jgi:hypothetical protein
MHEDGISPKNFEMPTLAEDKDLQKRIVSLSKSQDLAGLIATIKSMSSVASQGQLCIQSAKMAINISANMVKSSSNLNTISSEQILMLHDSIEQLISVNKDLANHENVQYSMVRMKLELGRIEDAIKTATACAEPRLRVFSVILEKCAQIHGNENTSTEIVDEIYKRSLIPSVEDFGFVIQSYCTCTDFANRNHLIDTFLQRISKDIESIDSNMAVVESLVNSIPDCSIVSIPPYGDSVCPVSGVRLPIISLTDRELDELIWMTRRLSTEATTGQSAEFDSIINPIKSNLPDIVLDGANIAHVNQNFRDGYFRFDQIKDILDHFSADNKCLVVLHKKWLDVNRDLRLSLASEGKPKKRKKPALAPLGVELSRDTVEEPESAIVSEIFGDSLHAVERPVPVDLVNEWRSKGQLMEIPHKQNDDWFWMHVCCLSIRDRLGDSSRVLLVSNDLMRDHYWRMKNPQSFKKFVKNHVARYSIQFGEDGINRYEYTLPPNHSICMHRHVVENGQIVWHIPFRSDGDYKWLVFSL